MNVPCPDCRSVFRVDPAKVSDAGIRARCNVCGGVIAIASREMHNVAPGLDLDQRVPSVDGIEPMSAPALVDTGAAFSADAAQDTPVQMPDRAVQDRAALGSSAAPDLAPAGAAPPRVEPSPAARPARPVNPYLNNTPELRARRLARALVSDLVAYNPQKREQGLRDGTLRQLFRDEIRKSWDEYVEQVGANVAESTPHFQDALNDVLAGGRRVF